MEKWVLKDGLGMWFVHFFCNLFLLSTIFKMPLVQPYAWTLTVEGIFYLVCAAVYGLWPRMRTLAVVTLLVAPAALTVYYPPFVFFDVGVLIFFLIHRDKKVRSAGLPRVGLASHRARPAGLSFPRVQADAPTQNRCPCLRRSLRLLSRSAAYPVPALYLEEEVFFGISWMVHCPMKR